VSWNGEGVVEKNEAGEVQNEGASCIDGKWGSDVISLQPRHEHPSSATKSHMDEACTYRFAFIRPKYKVKIRTTTYLYS